MCIIYVYTVGGLIRSAYVPHTYVCEVYMITHHEKSEMNKYANSCVYTYIEKLVQLYEYGNVERKRERVSG